jgi:hypothetical protein
MFITIGRSGADSGCFPLPLEWWPIIAFGGGLVVPLLMPSVRALGLCLVAGGLILAAAFFALERQFATDHSGFAAAIVLGTLIVAAVGFGAGVVLRLAALAIRRL